MHSLAHMSIITLTRVLIYVGITQPVPFPLSKHKSPRVLSHWYILIVAGLRLAVYLNLAVVGQPGWGENVDSNFRVQS